MASSERQEFAPHQARSVVEFEPDSRIALAVLGPVLAHLDEQEQMDLALQHLLELEPRAFAQALDLPAALAQHDRLLAGTLDIDDLGDLDAAVLELFPALCLDRGLIRQRQDLP